jgi:hypothetical protein
VYLFNGRRQLVAAATVIGALGVAPTAALAGWQAPQVVETVAPSEFVLTDAPGIDASGNAFDLVGVQNGLTPLRTDAVERPALAGTWQTPQLLQSSAARPIAANGSGGLAVASFLDQPLGSPLAAIRPAAGGFGAPQAIPGGQPAAGVSVAADSNGDAVAGWAAGGQLWTAIRPAVSGVWQAPVAVGSADAGGPAPLLAAGDDGTMTVEWLVHAVSPACTLRAATGNLQTGAWGAPSMLAKSKLSCSLSPENVTIGASGRALALWTKKLSLYASDRTGSSWTAGQLLTTARHEKAGAGVSVAIDHAGVATAAWTWTANDMVHVDTSPMAGSWPAPVLFNQAQRPDVVTDSSQRSLLTYDGCTAAGCGEVSSTRPSPSAAWSAPALVAQRVRTPRNGELRMNPAGTAIATWYDDTTGQVESAVYTP